MRHIITFVVLLTFCVAAQAQRVSHSFRNAPLAEVLTTLSREAKEHDIVFIHNELENCRVTARFNSLTIPEAVAAVTAEQPVRVKERLDVEYSLGDLSVGFNGTAGWNSSRSRREGFRAVDVRTFNYGPTLKIGLPWGLKLATDLTVYTNRGFSEPSANTTDVVWNARLSKRFMGSRLTLSLDGFDILGQLSNITHTLNSQGLTETWHNSLPRYVMAHLTWRFNKEPKKF
ncbi:MAG: DUF4974 domain-containing protein [Prevotella sp.]|nr:DUF4974 domain-containing protein [Prevotella sp.]